MLWRSGNPVVLCVLVASACGAGITVAYAVDDTDLRFPTACPAPTGPP